MVKALASHHVCHKSILRQEILVDTNGRSSSILVSRDKCAKKLKSRSHHQESLKKFILPVFLLETNYVVVVVKELIEVLEFELSVFLRGKTDKVDPLCSR